MTVKEKQPRKMPNGGRKGGAVFPRITLDEAVGYAKKLVSKTHVTAQPRDIIYSGVVGAKRGRGDVRISALKQYGLLIGDEKNKYSADELARRIYSAPEGELRLLYREAMLKPVIFKKLFDTYHGDNVTKAKLKQRVSELKVHPDEAERCVEVYASGMVKAGLLTVDGDRTIHVASSDVLVPALVSTGSTVSPEAAVPLDDENSEFEAGDVDGGVVADTGARGSESGADGFRDATSLNRSSQRAIFNVNVTLDSSMDIEKLAKQLELLKRFGAI